MPVNSRVSTKIQQLLNTLKRPKRPPLSEFFVDDSEEIVEGEKAALCEWMMSLVYACTVAMHKFDPPTLFLQSIFIFFLLWFVFLLLFFTSLRLWIFFFYDS